MPSLTSTPPDSICILRLSAIGDVCHTLPVVRSIQSHWPAARLTWVIGKTEAALLNDIAGIEFITFDKRSGFAAYRELGRQLKDRRFDVLLHMQIALRASLASMLVRAPVRIGFDRKRARDMQWLFSNRRIEARENEHVMDGLLGFTDALGVPRGSPRWDIPLSDADRAYAHELIPEDKRAVVISPCSSQRARNYRNWPAERFAAVADHAASVLGCRVIVTGGPTDLEREYANAIAMHTSCNPVNLVGKTNLKQLYAVLSAANAVVAPDSGPVHMANAAGTPVVGLYATSNPARTGPYSRRELTVDCYAAALSQYVGKTPADVRFGTRIRHPDAMSLITVDDVCDRLEKALTA